MADASAADAEPELPAIASAESDASFEPEMTDAVEAVEGDASEVVETVLRSIRWCRTRTR